MIQQSVKGDLQFILQGSSPSGKEGREAFQLPTLLLLSELQCNAKVQKCKSAKVQKCKSAGAADEEDVKQKTGVEWRILHRSLPPPSTGAQTYAPVYTYTPTSTILQPPCVHNPK